MPENEEIGFGQLVIVCFIGLKEGIKQFGCFCPSPRKGGIREFDRAIGVYF
jgi:hypothetical protein